MVMEMQALNYQAEIYIKIILAIGVGLLVGLEREHASKDIGLRTFSLASLLGLLTGMLGQTFAICGFIGILSIACFVNIRGIKTGRGLEVTTTMALLVTFFLGILVEQGHVFVPVALSILVTMLLAWKDEMTNFTQGLKLEEIRSAVVMGLLTFVIYPTLPDNYIDPWGLVNPKQAWLTIIVLAGLSFANYILLKLYSTKGLYYSALLGGAVNSTAAATEIAAAIRTPDGGVVPKGVTILLMVNVSMLIRNLVILGAFAPEAMPIAMAPLVGMLATAMFFIWRSSKASQTETGPAAPILVSSPVSLKKVLSFGALFLFIQVSGSLAQKFFGSSGFLAVSFFGGMVSSSSTTAAAAKLAADGSITATLAGISVIMTSISSAFINLPLVLQVTKNKAFVLKLALTTLLCIVMGFVLMACVAWMQSLFN